MSVIRTSDRNRVCLSIPYITVVLLFLIFNPATAASSNLSIRTMWENRLDVSVLGDAPQDIVALPDGTSIVTGLTQTSATDQDVLIVKYSPQGDLLWSYEYAGADSSWDGAYRSCADQDGNILVAGFTTQASGDVFLLKLSGNGDLIWQSDWDSPWERDDFPTGLAIDDSGSVYVSVRVQVDDSDFDIGLLKYSSDGDSLWRTYYSGDVPGGDFPWGLGLDDSGRVYVSGTVYNGAGTNDDLVTLKYSSAGELRWARLFNVQYEGFGFLSIPSTNHIYVCASVAENGIESDILVLCYDTSGGLSWQYRYQPLGNHAETPYAVISGADAGLRVIGQTTVGWLTIALDSSGNALWEKEFASSYSPRDCAIDSDERVFVCGPVQGLGGSIDAGIICYDSFGTLVWSNTYDGPSLGGDYGQSVAVDSNRVSMACLSWDSSTGFDFYTIGYERCDCGCHADPACDQHQDIRDVVRVIERAFRGGAAEIDSSCFPHEQDVDGRTDVDCNGRTDIIDVVRIVDVSFRGIPAQLRLCRLCD